MNLNEAPRRKRTGYLYVNYFLIAAIGREYNSGDPSAKLGISSTK